MKKRFSNGIALRKPKMVVTGLTLCSFVMLSAVGSIRIAASFVVGSILYC